jgi:hypothetical protein
MFLLADPLRFSAFHVVGRRCDSQRRTELRPSLVVTLHAIPVACWPSLLSPRPDLDLRNAVEPRRNMERCPTCKAFRA